MKKILAAVLSLLTVFSIALTFGGCKSGTKGKYEIWGVKTGNKEIAVADMSKSEIEEYFFDEIFVDSYIELKSKDVYVIYIKESLSKKEPNDYYAEQFVYGKYEITDQKIKLYLESKPADKDEDRYMLNATIKDGFMYLEMKEDFSYILKKGKSKSDTSALEQKATQSTKSRRWS